MNNNNNNENNQFGMLDMLTLISFMVQMKNIDDDEVNKTKNDAIIKATANEIDKLHKENDDIINYLKQIDKDEEKLLKKLDIIIDLLKGKI